MYVVDNERLIDWLHIFRGFLVPQESPDGA